MQTVIIDGAEYDADSLSEDARANLKSIQFVDAQIEQLRAKLAAMSTAKLAYGAALQQALSSADD